MAAQGPTDMDVASMLASLPPDLRSEILHERSMCPFGDVFSLACMVAAAAEKYFLHFVFLM
jgi:hypothetical protein